MGCGCPSRVAKMTDAHAIFFDRKDETLSFRTSKEIKQLLRAAAEKEHRSQASMLEVLILEYAKQHGIQSVENDIPQK